MSQHRTRKQKHIASLKRVDPANNQSTLYSFSFSKTAKISGSKPTSLNTFSQKDSLKDLKKTFLVSLIILSLLLFLWIKLK